MGTYGPGEIAELCSWCPPTIAVVTAIGPVHLERMKNLDVVEQAKYEITESARCVVLNVDDERLAGWVIRLEEQGKKVRTAGSSTPTASVRVFDRDGRWQVSVEDQDVVRSNKWAVFNNESGLRDRRGARSRGELRNIVAGLARVVPVANRSNVATAPRA